MKEHPIIFSGPMVLAILDGRKTQTRRVVKPQPPRGCFFVMNGAGDKALCMQAGGSLKPWFVPPRATSADTFLSCPYGVPGDHLWVRETWGASPVISWGEDSYLSVRYRAGGNEKKSPKSWKLSPHSGQWRPSIHMPRWASRLTLEVVSVRVERVQEISEEDARAEGAETYRGISPEQSLPGPGFNDARLGDEPHRLPFAVLWDSINGKRPGCSWDANPWVWVLEFKPTEARP